MKLFSLLQIFLLHVLYFAYNVKSLGTISITLYPNTYTSIIGNQVKIAAILSVTNLPIGGILPLLNQTNFIFQNNNTNLNCTLSIAGTIVICETSSLLLGDNLVGGKFLGDGNYPVTNSISPSRQTVNKGSVILFINPPFGTSNYGSNVIFTGTLIKQTSSSYDPVLSQSTIVFKTLKGVLNCSVFTVSGFNITCTTNQLPAGSNQVFLVFNGDGNFDGATSQVTAAFTVVVATPPLIMGVNILKLTPLFLAFTARSTFSVGGGSGVINFVETSVTPHRAPCFDRPMNVLNVSTKQAYCRTTLYTTITTVKTIEGRYKGDNIYLPATGKLTFPKNVAAFAIWKTGVQGTLSDVQIVFTNIRTPKPTFVVQNLNTASFLKLRGALKSQTIQVASTDPWVMTVNNIFPFLRLYLVNWQIGKYQFTQTFTICSSNGKGQLDTTKKILTTTALFSGILCFTQKFTNLAIKPSGTGAAKPQYLTVASSLTL